jgi:transcriptional antiterminator RfaH
MAWFCARTKPKHEHIAAADLNRNLGLEVFQPKLVFRKATRVGMKRTTEPVFPCYLFVRCVIDASLHDILRTNGVRTIVQFGRVIPRVPDSIIQELQQCFATAQLANPDDLVAEGAEVVLAEGAFAGMHASVLRVLPAKQRVMVMLDILGRSTSVEVGWEAILPERHSLSRIAPFLAGRGGKTSPDRR